MQQKYLLITILTLCLSFAEAREMEAYCTWDDAITESRLEVADAALLTERRSSHREAIDAALNEHLPFGFPSYADEQNEHLLAQADFLIWYDNDLRAPLWTAHHLSRDEATARRERADTFRSDPRLRRAWSRSECADYKEPIFDRGHLVPRADMNHSEVAMDQTYLMSNMTPQHCAFNRGVWQVLEGLGRDWASQVDDSWIITGSVFDRDGLSGRDADQTAWRMRGKRGVRVAIPSQQYKIFVRRNGQGWSSLSFLLPNTDTLMPNEEVENYLSDHIVTLEAIHAASGFSFLHDQVVTEENTLWQRAGELPRQLTSSCNQDYPQY